MRFTLKLFVKALFLVTGLLLVLPLLLSRLDSQEESQAKEIIRRVKRIDPLVERSQGGDAVFHVPEKQVLDKPVLKKDADHLQKNGGNQGAAGVIRQIEEPEQVHDRSTTTQSQKKLGPKAVFKDGILGNYEPRNIQSRAGPGEGGSAVYTSMAEKAESDASVRDYGFNMVASNKISMVRTIPDTRMDECKYWHYPDELPTASVIIVFHNEGWSTLLRTVHSVINMSPAHLLHEVVMVDDFSDKEHLKGRLEEYISANFNGKVKLFRNKERLGLIRTRTLGAEYSTGDVILFLDAHCECNKNWLPPLLERIAYDRTKMAVPIIDGIDWNTFRYTPVYNGQEHFRGIFEWGFLYKESKVPQKELDSRQHNSQPYSSPTHAGGLFAMDRKYFFELGGYDPGLMIWGGENFELSFKIWQCGGSIEWVPCSRVGHVYRNHMPYSFGKISPKIPVILINYMRVVEVWLDDEFKDYFYTREPTIRGYPIGNLTAQLALKKKYNCKSFKWFMDNVAYEVYEKFPPPPPNKAWGEIKQKNGFQCWDTMGQQVGSGSIGITPCHHYGGNQLFRLNEKGQLAVGERCIEASSYGIGVHFCAVEPTGPWDWDKETGLIHHTKTNKCIQPDSNTRRLELAACDVNDPAQQWEINKIKTW